MKWMGMHECGVPERMTRMIASVSVLQDTGDRLPYKEKVCLVLKRHHPDLSIPAGLSSVQRLVLQGNVMADGGDRDMCRLEDHMGKVLQKARGHTGIDSDCSIIFCLQNYPGPSRRQ